MNQTGFVTSAGCFSGSSLPSHRRAISTFNVHPQPARVSMMADKPKNPLGGLGGTFFFFMNITKSKRAKLRP